ncbi:MAG: hypothetical protein IKU25_05170 [Clostridia bacterium]|nr:hypothetical protein [Clostridia bacterium]
MPQNDYNSVIKTCAKELDRLMKGKEWKDDEKITQLLSIYKEAIYYQIHNILAPKRNSVAEKEIRDIIARYVIGCVDKKSKINYIGAIRPICAKIAQIGKSKKTSQELLARYMELYDDFMALASFRSFKHFCLYIEENYAPEDKKIWCYAEKHGIAEGMWYCLGNMALRGEFKTLFKQTPTGYFKTYSNICFIAWLLGINANTDILYVLGNPAMVKKVHIGVKQQMLRPKYAKIFPNYQKFGCDEQKMFVLNNSNEGELLVSGANSMCNLKVVAKDTPIDGTRFKWRFYDDITRSKDKLNTFMHEKDNEMYHDDWTKRRYTEFEDYEIFSGTAYNLMDLICRQKENKGVSKSVPCQFKYCTINAETRTMFVKIPKLDYETDESTLPEKYTTFSARKERERDLETFMAMEQQEPIPPTGLPFDWKKIKTYTELPEKEENGGTRSNVCRAVLDPARIGTDNLSLGVHSKCGDLEYLVTCFYRQTPLDGKMEDGRTALDHCCDMLIEKNVVELVVETNTVSNIKSQIEQILFSRGYRSCEIKEIYSTRKKADKIYDNQSTILEYIVFPDKSLYGASSMMGQFMKDVTGWSANTKAHDDSIDTEAIFSDHFIRGKMQKTAKAKLLYV